ncbi:MAG TPA: sodium:solute symporter family protein [Planctomycetota bacterium]|nr:sodium:solute symporter family protein [Planctomycetota bacterium]
MDTFATNFSMLDWWIVGAYLAISVAIGVVVNKYIHSVSDYMLGGRGAGTALNAATFIGTGLGLVTIMYASMDGFSKGFAFMILPLIGLAVGLTLGSTGFVIRRLREQRLVTLPEYFQRRYSRSVRVTAGIICALAGILNMGLFPKMGAVFVTYSTGLGRSQPISVQDWPGFCAKLTEAGAAGTPSPHKRLFEVLPEDARAAVEQGAGDESQRAAVLKALNGILSQRDFYSKRDFAAVTLPAEAEDLLKLGPEKLSEPSVEQLNRLLLEAAYPRVIVESAWRQELTVNLIMSALILLVLLYTVLGGMVSVIVTDYMQFIVLSIGLGLGLYFCLARPDLGWDHMVGALKQHRGAAAFNPVHANSYGWVWVIWMAMHFAAAALCWAPEATRALTSKDPATTKRTFLFGSPGQFVRLALPALLAIAAFCFVAQNRELTAHFFPNGLGGKAENAGQAMPLLLGKIVPAGLLGVLVAGLMAAFMSTHDSYFLCWSSVITRDIIAPLRRERLNDRQQIRIARIAILCIGAFLLVWGVWYKLPDSVWNYMAVTGSVWLCGSVVVLVGGMYWKRASSAGALAALLGGLMSIPVIFLPEDLKNDTLLMGQIGLENYAFCVVLFVFFSLRYPDRKGSPAQETRP